MVEVEIKDECVQVFEGDDDILYVDDYFYIFGILHLQCDLSTPGGKGLKTAVLFRRDLIIEPFEDCRLD